MSILKNLEFSTVEAPKNNRNAMSTMERARSKFLASLNTQIAAAEAYISGQSSYTVTKKRYQTMEDGERRRVDKDVEVRPWWFEKDGAFFITPKYANKPLELSKGKPSIAGGDAMPDVLAALMTIRDAVDAGELDKALEASAVKTRQRMSKK